MTPDLDAIERRANAATPGPWEALGHSHMAIGCRCMSCDDPTVGFLIDHKHALYCDDLVAKRGNALNSFGKPLTSCDNGPLLTYEDAIFAVEARNDIPALIKYCRELEAQRDSAYQEVYRLRQERAR